MTRERYESISLHDLREIAKNRGMRRISTLKKADLIDAMLKKDEEEAILLRNERIQRRQMQEAAQGTQDGVRPARDEAGEAGGKEAEDVTGTSRSADGQDGAGQESAARTEGDNPPRQRSGNDRQGQENTAAGLSDYDRKDKSAAGDSSRARQRNQGVQRGRQGSGNYNPGTGAGRRQNNAGRIRRDDRQNTQNGRQNRPVRQSGQSGSVVGSSFRRFAKGVAV